MAEPVTTVDPRIYGGDAPTNDPVPEIDPNGLDSRSSLPNPAPTQVPSTSISDGTADLALGTQQLAINNPKVASTGDSALAAVKTWSPVRVWDWVNMPHFDADPDYDPKGFINQIPFTLDEDEHKFLAQSQSADEMQYRFQSTKQQRDLYQQMGDHPVISSLVAMADPAYLALDLASFGVAGAVGSAVNASNTVRRVGQFALSAGSTYGLGRIQQDVVPMSDKDVVFAALMNGAGTAMRVAKASEGLGKGFVKVDPDFPSDDLSGALNRMKNGTDVGVEQKIVSEAGDVASTKVPPEPAPVAPDVTLSRTVYDYGTASTKRGVTAADRATATDGLTFLTKHAEDPTFGPLIKTLMEEQPDLVRGVQVVTAKNLAQNGRPFYEPSSHTVFMSETGEPLYRDARTALHEMVHGITSQKIEYGLKNPTSAHGRIVNQLETLRAQARTHVANNPSLYADNPKLTTYLQKDTHEFVAGLFSGDTEFTQGLAKMSYNGTSTNVLSKLVDGVRKLLGLAPNHSSALTQALGLTDDLIKTKLDLNVKAPDGSVVTHNLAPVMDSPPTGTQSQIADTIIKRQEGLAAKVGSKIEWSLHKTLSKLGTVGQKVADLLVDDPVNMRGDSVVSQRTAIRADLARKQYVYEDLLKQEMATRGAGLFKRVTQPGKAADVQRVIEREVYDELMARSSAARRGADSTGLDPKSPISKLADAHDAATAAADKERKAAKVLGADGYETGSGYATRKWSITQIESATDKLVASGMSEKNATRALRDLVANGMRTANPTWATETANDVASAILARAKAKGYFEDSQFRGHIGNAGAEQIRAILKTTGITDERIQRALDVVTGVTDEAGKSSSLKHRIDIDMGQSIQVEGKTPISVTDLVDTNLTRNLDSYLDGAAGDSALARKGLDTPTKVAELRREFLGSIDSEADRAKAADLFDNTINAIRGNPVGEKVADGLRKLSQVTQMVGLASSGLWQMTEYAGAMQKYGFFKTMKYTMAGMPVLRSLMADMAADRNLNTGLTHILSHNSVQDIRIRPFVQKMEDNFEMNLGDHALLSLSQAKQAVPYINAMRYIHHNQANAVANLITDVFSRAVHGDAEAISTLGKYGLEAHHLDSIKSDVLAGGLDTAKWSDATWAQVRGPLAKMMDESVLKNRTGELPAFAQFSSVGKFIFTFRSFVLGAHNKVLAGSLGRDGFSGLGLLMLYQFPLTMLASYANSVTKGKPETDMKKLANLSVAQMGAMGLFSELYGIISGDKQQFGASGLMAIDRLYKTGSAAATGQWGTASSGLVNSIPLLSILPGVKAMSEQLKTLNPKKEVKPKD